jgi:hypothetical protein
MFMSLYCAEGGDPASEEGLVMSDHMPAQEDHSVQPGHEPSVSDTAEFAAMRAVMRASEKHREGGVDPELEDIEPDPGPDT